MQRLLPLGLTLLLAGVASAQSPIGPFVGQESEGFETQNVPNPFPPCVEDRVFNDQADLCANSASITGSWGFGCTIFPHSGSRFFGSTGSEATYTFDATATRFGGYFGTNNPSAPDGTIEFYDAGGSLLGTTQVITAPNDCTWTWNGWDLAGLGEAKSIVVRSNYTSPGFMMMDDMEVDFGAGGGPGTALCFGDGSGAPCGCGNESDQGSDSGCLNSVSVGGVGAVLAGSGTASLGNPDLTLDVSGVLTQPGLFFQGNNTINGGAGQPFGDGIRCCGGSVVRLSLEDPPAGTEPTSTTTTITSTDGSITPGDERCYQYWYRDPSGPCGSSFNLSNAFTVTWGP